MNALFALLTMNRPSSFNRFRLNGAAGRADKHSKDRVCCRNWYNCLECFGVFLHLGQLIEEVFVCGCGTPLELMCGGTLLRIPSRSLSVLVGSANQVKVNAVQRALLALDVEAQVTGAIRG